MLFNNKKIVYLACLVIGLSFILSTGKKTDTALAATTLCSTTTATITQTSAPVIYIDNSPVLDAVYVSYRINTGATVSFSDLWVQLENFSSANLSLAGTEDGLYHIGPVSTSGTEDVYFFLAGTETAVVQSYDVVLYDGHPSYGGSETCYESRSHTEVSDTIQAVSNKVTSVVATAPYVGGAMTITVTGDTGTIGAAGIFNYIPASVSSWPADCYELYDTEITLTGGNTGTYYDGLYLTGLNSSATAYTVIYSFTAKCTTASSTSVTPLNNISSGTQIKHTSTSTSTYTSIPPILPAENQLNLTKNASPGGSTGGGTATYTVTVHNDSPVAVTVDYFQDTLPSSPASASYVSSSSKYDAVSISEPNINGQILTWTDIFTIPAGGSKDLTYNVSIPANSGNYANNAVAFVGNTQIDLTKDTTDDTPATSTYGVGDPTLSTSTKTSIDLNGGDLVPGDTIRYTITVSNGGTVNATGVSLTDTIDSNTELVTNVVIAASSSACGSSYVNNSTSTLLSIANLDVATAADCIVTFDVSVKSAVSDQTSILNTATVGVSNEGGVGGSPSSSPLTVDVDPFLTLAKTENDADNTVSAGQTVTYTITVGNTGLANATGIDITDTIGGTATITLVDNFTFLNCGSDYVNNSTGTTISIDNVDTSTAADCVVTYDVTVDSGASNSQTVTNNADIGEANEGGNNATAVSASTLTVGAATDPVLGVTKTENDADDTVTPGQTITYTITIANTGNETATTSFTDAIDSDYGSPGNFNFTNCGGSESSAFVSPTLTVSNLVITTSQNCVITYNLVVDDPSTDGTTLTNSVDVALASEGGNDPVAVAATTLTVDGGTPTAVNDTASVVENSSNNIIDWDNNDSLIDGATLNTFDSTSTQSGTVTDNGNGSFNYTPATGFFGTDTFNYTICDNDTPTATCDSATVTVTVLEDADNDGLPNNTDTDDDQDGIDDSVEGAGPNGGDVNGDGVDDNTQSNVSSLPNTENDNLYVSLQSGGIDCGVINSFGTVSEESLATQSDEYIFPLGLFDFTIACTNPGDATTITFYLDKEYDTSDWVYIKYDGTVLSYEDFSGKVTFGTTIVGGVTVTTISYSVTDGGPIDEDKLKNGLIVDPSGPAVPTAALAKTGLSTYAYQIVSFVLIIATFIVALSSLRSKKSHI